MAESAGVESEKGIPFSRGGYLFLSRSLKESEVWGRGGRPAGEAQPPDRVGGRGTFSSILVLGGGGRDERFCPVRFPPLRCLLLLGPRAPSRYIRGWEKRG